MELFSVTCTTCHSKLKVRDRQAIGQILACPKCSAMVLVQPPEGWVEMASAPATPAVVASTLAVPSTTVPLVTPTPPGKPIASNFEDAAALLSSPAAPPASEPPVQQAIAPPEVAAVGPSAEPASAPASSTSRWLVIGGLGTLALALIAAIGFALSGGDDDAIAATTPDAPASPVVPAVVEPIPGEPTESPAPDQVKPMVPAVDPVKQPPDEDPATTQPDPAPPLPKPLEIVDAAPPDSPDEKPKAIDTFNIDGSLQEFGALIEDKGFGTPSPAKPDADPPVPMPPGPAEATAPVGPISDEEPLPRPQPRKIDVARRLNDPLEGLEFSGLPLADFLQLITDITLVPITLDPAALPAIKVSPETKVTVSLKATKVGEALTAALAPHNLAFVATDTQIVVLPAASTKSELREIKHDLADLAKSEAEAKVLAEMVHACIAPASWDDAGGTASMKVDGTLLVVAQSPENHFGIVLLCEKLRLARKLPTRSTYPPHVLTLAPRASAADALLSAPVTVNFVPPTRLGRVCDYVKKAHGVRVLVDWRAVSDAGWTPEGEVKAGVAAQPLSAFLDRLAGRMDLAWRAIDAQTVELTTPAELERHADVEVFPVAAADAAALIEKLQKELGAGRFIPGANFALRYDTAGHCLVARLPQPQIRQLQAILAKAAP